MVKHKASANGNNGHHHHRHPHDAVEDSFVNGDNGGVAVWHQPDEEDEDVFNGSGHDDEERDSLLRETADQTALHSRQALRFRKAARPNPNRRAQNASSTTTVLGLLRGNSTGSFLCQGVAVTGILAALQRALEKPNKISCRS